MSITEGYRLILGILADPDSRLRAAYLGTDRMSLEALMSVDIYNAIIAGLDAKPNVKKKLFKKLKKGKKLDKNGIPIEPKKMTQAEKDKKFAHVKVAQPKEGGIEDGQEQIQDS